MDYGLYVSPALANDHEIEVPEADPCRPASSSSPALTPRKRNESSVYDKHVSSMVGAGAAHIVADGFNKTRKGATPGPVPTGTLITGMFFAPAWIMVSKAYRCIARTR